MAVTNTSVVIVGCGPVGAVLANLLGQAGIDVIVLEREAAIHQLPRAVGLDSESMRVFETIGVAENVVGGVSISPALAHYVNGEGQTLMTQKLDGVTEHGWNAGYLIHQPDLEAVLREGLARWDSVDVRLRHDVFAMTDRGNQVTVHVEDLSRGSTYDIDARYVVGCDGARSLVRRIISPEFSDLGLHQPWLVVDLLQAPGVSLPQEPVQHCNPARPSSYIPVGDHRLRLELMVMPEDDLATMTQPDRVWELVAPWVTPEQATIERAVVYTFHSLIATVWSADRLFIAGDAAHQTPPFLGQGMNAGIRDAANLAWKLEWVLAGRAPATLLDSYQIECEAHVREVIEGAVEVGKVIQATGVDAERRDRDMLAGAVPGQFFPPIPRLGPGLHESAGPPAGTPAPQWQFDGERMDGVVGRRFAVIGDSALLDAVTSQTRDRWQQDDVVVRAAPEDAAAWLAEQDARAVVIRPDRYVLGIAATAAELDTVSSLLPERVVQTASR